jgi:glycosyltransferase involved in cell wall biosynthesis
MPSLLSDAVFPVFGNESVVGAIAVDGLSVCIPVYNESAGVAETIRRCLACEPALKRAGVSAFEVIVVDDGSRDDTAEHVRKFPVRLIQHAVNRGYGAALKTGFSAARYDLVGFLDADATYPPESFPDLCRPVLAGRADLVIGSRMSGADSQMPLTRRLGNFFFARLLTVIGRTDVSDTASGMRVFRKSALGMLSPLPDGLNLTPVMSTRAAHEAVRVVEVPISYEEREGRSKLNVVKDGLRFLETIVWTAMTYNPVRILGLLGLAGMGVAAAVGLGLLIFRLQGVTALGPLGIYAVFAAVVCGAAGVSVFALGASFNYLVSLFHRRPIRQGLFRKPLFDVPIERVFLPCGVVAAALGLVMSVVSLSLSFRGWQIERLWLYLSGSAMLMLIGIQLSMSWLQMSVLHELSERERLETPIS